MSQNEKIEKNFFLTPIQVVVRISCYTKLNGGNLVSCHNNAFFLILIGFCFCYVDIVYYLWEHKFFFGPKGSLYCIKY